MSGAARLFRRLYAWLLRLYPGKVRRDFAGEMWGVALRRDEARREAGGGPGVGYWIRECLALVWSVAGAWADVVRRSVAAGRVAHELRLALRGLVRRPGYALVGVVTLALGIGANAVIFSITWGVLLDPLPHVDESRLVHIWEDNRAQGGNRWELAPADFVHYRAEARALDDLAGYAYPRELTWTGDGDARVVRGLPVTGNFFSVVGAVPVLGRTLVDGDQLPEPANVAVASHAFWQSALGGDPDVVGRVLTLNGEPVELVGVMPPGFTVQRWPVQLWYPENWDPGRFSRSFHVWYGVGRLAPGRTPADAEEDLLRLARGLGAAYPETNEGHLVTLLPLKDALVGAVRPALLVLLGVVGVVLLIACSNVANVALVRALRRRRETAVRAALGAGRWRLIRESLAEGVLVAGAGAATGVLLAYVGLDPILGLIPVELPGVDQVAVNAPVLGATVAVTGFVALFVSLAPLPAVLRSDLMDGLRQGDRSASASRRHRRLQGGLVVAQLALAVLLLIGAGLLIRSFRQLRAVDPGVAIGSVLTAELSLSRVRYPGPEERLAFWDRFLERAAALPGVESVSLTSALPIEGGGFGSTLTLDTREQPPENARPTIRVRVVGPDFFQTLGVPVQQGRAFDGTERIDAPLVAVVNETLAARYLPPGAAAGSRVKIGPDPERQPWIRVVGVAGDIREQGLRAEVEPAIYLSNAQDGARSLKVVARTTGDPAAAGALRGVVEELDPGIPLHRVRTLEAVASASLARERATTLLLGLFAGLATLLAALGVYAVVAYSVAQRLPEMGVRMALGADPRAIIRMVVGGVVRGALLAAAIGLALALAATRLLEGLVHGISTTDPATFVATPVLLLLVVALAAYLPARRAAATDPTRTLRRE